MNRRHLLQFASAAMFQSHAIDRVRAATSGAGTHTPEEIAADEDFWSEIRAAFSVDRNVINLNNGYVSPSPRPVQDAMRRYLEYSDMGPYHTMINVLERQVESVRRRLAQAAGCDPEEMAITRNASEALAQRHQPQQRLRQPLAALRAGRHAALSGVHRHGAVSHHGRRAGTPGGKRAPPSGVPA